MMACANPLLNNWRRGYLKNETGFSGVEDARLWGGGGFKLYANSEPRSHSCLHSVSFEGGGVLLPLLPLCQ